MPVMASEATLRDMFACHAPAPSESVFTMIINELPNYKDLTPQERYVKALVKWRYIYADQMVAERSQVVKEPI